MNSLHSLPRCGRRGVRCGVGVGLRGSQGEVEGEEGRVLRDGDGWGVGGAEGSRVKLEGRRGGC